MYSPDQPASNWEDRLEKVFIEFTTARGIYTYDGSPQNWARITKELGTLTLMRKKGGKSTNLRSAITFFTEALKVYQRELYPLEWAECQRGIGKAFRLLADGRDPSFREQALYHYEMALAAVTRDSWPELWHGIHMEIAMLHHQYALASAELRDHTLAQEHYALAVGVDKEKYPEVYDSLVSLYSLYDQLIKLKEKRQ
jgi:tetratricopeptide (TPR) repeat protein